MQLPYCKPGPKAVGIVGVIPNFMQCRGAGRGRPYIVARPLLIRVNKKSVNRAQRFLFCSG